MLMNYQIRLEALLVNKKANKCYWGLAMDLFISNRILYSQNISIKAMNLYTRIFGNN